MAITPSETLLAHSVQITALVRRWVMLDALSMHLIEVVMIHRKSLACLAVPESLLFPLRS